MYAQVVSNEDPEIVIYSTSADVQVLSKTLDNTALTPEKVELATLVHDDESDAVRPPPLPCKADFDVYGSAAVTVEGV